jgi:Ser-tRNA(Ala) deacylase AlaX
MPTKPVYQYDEALRKHPTRITAIRSYHDLPEPEKALYKAGDEQTLVIEMNETIFYAQGGGQPFDVGTMIGRDSDDKEATFDVQSVRSAQEGRILHFGVLNGKSEMFANGSMVEQHIDGKRRDHNSRSHTAGHIVALAVRKLAETIPELRVIDLKAQHYPDASYVEFGGTIDGKFKDEIEKQTMTFVRDALPVKLYWLKPDEVATHDVITSPEMPVVSGQDGLVRIVDIVGAGAYPCGGTHVPDTLQVGEVTISRIKRQKGISRISYIVKDFA